MRNLAEPRKIYSVTEYLASSVNYAPTIPLRTVAEYFAGIGLVRMGLETQGWQITYANDISLKKYELYKGLSLHIKVS